MPGQNALRVRITPKLDLSPVTLVLIGWMAVTAFVGWLVFV